MNNDLLNQNLQKNQYNNNSTKYIENKLIQKGGTSQKIRILTYNIGLNSSTPQERKDNLIKYIDDKSSKRDIVGLQESKDLKLTKFNNFHFFSNGN